MSEKTISNKLKELNDKIEWFYGDDFSLDDASEKYKEAAGLAKEIEKDLSELKNKIELLSEDFTKE